MSEMQRCGSIEGGCKELGDVGEFDDLERQVLNPKPKTRNQNKQ
jgi:hypothetical protein